MKFKEFTRISFIAAPAFLFIYGVAYFFDGLDGSYGPGLAWTIGHIMFFLGLVTFGVVIIGLYLRIERKITWRKVFAGCAVIIGLVGLIAFIRSPIIDIIAGLRAPDHAALGALQDRLNV